jgi:hypothetical protein
MSRCHICGKRREEPECDRCKPIRDLFGDKFGVLVDWVSAIAKNEADDAVIGHLNDEDHS